MITNLINNGPQKFLYSYNDLNLYFTFNTKNFKRKLLLRVSIDKNLCLL